MLRAGPLLGFLALVALAGCAAERGDAGMVGWADGDRWTYALRLPWGDAEDDWVVTGRGLHRGLPVFQVDSATRGAGLVANETGFFDARTLALVHVVGADRTVDFDPAEVVLLPPEDRSYEARVVETRSDGTTVATVRFEVDHLGDDSVETRAGTFAAHRYRVVRTQGEGDEARSATLTYWFAPAVLNVVRVDDERGPVRELTWWYLAPGSRTPLAEERSNADRP